ncbi:PTS transporter [Streptococcus pneumoniae]|nr:PTS transporter [Streptococcus pneumoniae]VJX81966.1 PTS transporter [Streptococcus pneumoniae]VLX54714.1 PTS transporter [Streptococcus pneumoniae]VMO81913.1 PTS transporter [Streptococcus pneumoniae]VMS97899.1 PTS transporter [Streptococcus pneumoniae]
MDKKERQKIEQQRREMALTNTFFNRYLLLRYSIALFFFGNIYWLLNQFISPSPIIIIFPIMLIVFSILATIEQFKLYGNRKEKLGITLMFVRIQMLISIGLLVLTWTSWFKNLFPIFENNQVARLFVFVVLLLGLVLSLLDIRRIKKIYKRTDKAYQQFVQLEKNSLSL